MDSSLGINKANLDFGIDGEELGHSNECMFRFTGSAGFFNRSEIYKHTFQNPTPQVDPQKIAHRFERAKTTRSFSLPIRHIIFSAGRV